MTWKERWIGIPLAVAGGLLALVAAAAFVLTRTPWGHDRAQELLTRRVLSGLRGDVTFGGITGGDLLREVRLAQVRVRDPDGGLVLEAEAVGLEYDWHDFLRGDIVFQSVQLFRPVIILEEGRDGRWNFERALETRARPEPRADRPSRPGDRRRLELRRISIRDGRFEVRTPLDAPSEFWRTESRLDGPWQALRLLGFDAELPILRLASRSPRDPVLIRIGDLSGTAHVVAEPAEIRQLRAQVTVRDDTVRFEVDRVELPSSRLTGRGVVHVVEPGPQIDLEMEGERVSFADMTWLVPGLPPAGRGRFGLRLATRREGLAFDFERADLRIGDSRVTGRFGFVLQDDGLRYERVDLRLDPLETRWIDTITADTLFFQGRLRGTVRGDGPLSRMALETDLALEPPGERAPSRVTASGTLTWDGSFGGDSLEMSLDGVDVATVQALLDSDLPVEGRLTGTMTFRGTLLRGLRVDADLVHSDRTRASSHLVGGGHIFGVERPRLELQVEGTPLSLTTLSEYYPALPFRGEARGPVGLRGTLDSLEVDARLRTPRGRLVVRGWFDLAGEPMRYRAGLEGEEVQVAALRPGIPHSNLAFEAYVEGEGLTPEELELQGWVRIRPSEFAGARVDSGFARLVARGGLLVVDSAGVRSEAGRLRARGSFGLREDTQGVLEFEFVIDTLGAWNRWIAPAEDTGGPAVTFADGSGALPAFADGPIGSGAAGPLRGAARGSGTVSGNLHSLRLNGQARLVDVGWGDVAADSVALAVTAEGPPRTPVVRGRVDARGVEAAGLELSAVGVELGLAGDTARIAGMARKGDVARLATRGEVVRLPEGLRITVDSLAAAVHGREIALEAPATLERRGRTLDLGLVRLSGSMGTVTAEAEVPETGPASVRLRVAGLDLADVAAVLPGELDLRGPLRVDLRLAGSPTAPSADFEAEVGEGSLAGVEFSRLVSRGGYEAEELRLETSGWRGRERLFEATARIPMRLDLHALSARRTSDPMELRVRAEEFPLAFALATFDQFRDVTGRLRGEVALRGSLDEPELRGAVELSDGQVRIPHVGVRLFGAEGRVRFQGDRAELADVVAQAPEGGRGRVEGSVRLRPLSNPEFDLRFRVDRLLAYNTRVARAAVSGSVELTGVYRRPEIRGELTVESSTLFIREIERRQEIIDLSDPAFFNVVDTTVAEGRRLVPLVTDPFFQNMTVNLTLHLARDSWLRGRDRAVELAGDLQLRWDRAQQDLRMSGTLEALRGEYTYVGKRFSVVGGTIEFVGSPGVNPDLNLIARHVVQTPDRPLTIRIIVTGTLENPRIRLESDAQPPLDESALLSYLIFGRPFSDLTRRGPGGPGVVSTVGESALGVALSELEAFLVSETGLVDYLEITGGRGVHPAYGEDANGAGLATRVEVGRYVLPAVFVTVGQRFGGTQRSDIPDIRVDWRVTRNLSLQFVSEERSRRIQAATTETPAPQRTYGLFFFHEWSY